MFVIGLSCLVSVIRDKLHQRFTFAISWINQQISAVLLFIKMSYAPWKRNFIVNALKLTLSDCNEI